MPDTSIVEFYEHDVPQPFLSEQEGHPVYKKTDYVRIMTPGYDKQKVVRPVKDEDKERWPNQWGSYKRGQEQVIEGTPLSAWPAMVHTEIVRLNSFNIRTVEAVRDLDDIGLQKLGHGARDMQRRAKFFLEESVPASAVAGIKGQNERLLSDAHALTDKETWEDEDAVAASALAERLATHVEAVGRELSAMEERHRTAVKGFVRMGDQTGEAQKAIAERIDRFRNDRDRKNAGEEEKPEGNGASDDPTMARMAALEEQNRILKELLGEREKTKEPAPPKKHVLGRPRKAK